MTKGNSGQPPADRTLSRGHASSGLDRVRAAARRDPSLRFTALLHHVTPGLLWDAYHALKHDAAPGVDGETWVGYGENLEDRLADLHARVHSGRYRAKPSSGPGYPRATGGCVRYADDFVVGFQHRDDAERCLAEMRERFARFGLELHPEKTRLIEPYPDVRFHARHPR